MTIKRKIIQNWHFSRILKHSWLLMKHKSKRVVSSSCNFEASCEWIERNWLIISRFNLRCLSTLLEQNKWVTVVLEGPTLIQEPRLLLVASCVISRKTETLITNGIEFAKRERPHWKAGIGLSRARRTLTSCLCHGEAARGKVSFVHFHLTNLSIVVAFDWIEKTGDQWTGGGIARTFVVCDCQGDHPANRQTEKRCQVSGNSAGKYSINHSDYLSSF